MTRCVCVVFTVFSLLKRLHSLLASGWCADDLWIKRRRGRRKEKIKTDKFFLFFLWFVCIFFLLSILQLVFQRFNFMSHADIGVIFVTAFLFFSPIFFYCGDKIYNFIDWQRVFSFFSREKHPHHNSLAQIDVNIRISNHICISSSALISTEARKKNHFSKYFESFWPHKCLINDCINKMIIFELGPGIEPINC